MKKALPLVLVLLTLGGDALAQTTYPSVSGEPVSVPADKEFFVRYVQELKAYVESLPWDDPAVLESYRNAYDQAIEAFRK
jgi:hypothetical protein